MMKNNRQRTKEIATNTVREFCTNTTVHGFRYFTEKNLSRIERMWWLLSIVVMIVLCTIVTVNIWMNWRERPVIVSLDDKTTSIAMIPFPAVTICSTQVIDQNKLDVHALLNQFRSFEVRSSDLNFTLDDVSKIDAMAQLCASFVKTSSLQIVRFGSIYEAIESIAPDASITIGMAEFHSETVFFQPIFTERGLCYTFNSMNSRDIYSDEVATQLLTVDKNPNASHWNIELGYIDDFNENETFPKRVFGIKSFDMLTVYMGLSRENVNNICSDISDQFYLALHSPDELPRITEDFMLIQPNQESRVTVSPVLMRTSNGLRGYSPEIRGCFFKSERKLRFFKTYNQNHCELECLANYTGTECNCIPFYLPRDKVTRVCTMYDSECYWKADYDITKSQNVHICHCLPNCISLTYNAISSQANIHEYVYAQSNVSFGRSRILFKQSNFIGLKRSETGTMADFIASFGGLLGLFMGVSILSIIELVYYFTLRLFFKIRHERKPRIKRVAPASRIPRLTVNRRPDQRSVVLRINSPTM